MKTIYELQQISKRLRAVTEADSISPEDTFGLMADLLEYIADMEQNADGLGIHKVYANHDKMLADSVAPVGSNGKPLRFGQLVAIFDSTNAAQPENGNIYAWQKGNTASPWSLMGKMGSIPTASSDNAGLMSATDKQALDQYSKWVNDNANFIIPLYRGQDVCEMDFVSPDGNYDFSIPIASSKTAGVVSGKERDALKDLMNFNKQTAEMPFRNDDGSLDFSAELVMTSGNNNLWCVAFKSDENENQRYLATYNETVISEKRYIYKDDSSHDDLYIWFISLPTDAAQQSCDLSIE